MTSEVSHYEFTRLQSDHAELEKEVRRLTTKLWDEDMRRFRRSCDLEFRLTGLSLILFGLSIAFTLFSGYCMKHSHRSSSETAVEPPAVTD